MAQNPLVLTTSGGLKELPLVATNVATDVTNFDALLSSADTTVQKALDTLDNHTHSASVIPAGAMSPYAGASAPSGWLLCDGAAVSRSTYAALFSAIGTTYGAGDSSTTFNVPDARGRALFGAGQGSGLTNRVLGATGGEEAHALTSAENGSHTHTIQTSSRDASGGRVNIGQTTYGGALASTDSSGSGTAHNTMPPFLVVNYIIKT